MLPRSPRTKLLKVEGEQDTVDDNKDGPPIVTEDVSQVLTVPAYDKNTGDQENIVMNLTSISTVSTSSAGENPLQNPVILHHLFQLCPVSIVASCRLICKLWYDESVVTWRTAFPVTIAEENDIVYLIHRNQRGNPSYLSGIHTPLKEFLEFIGRPGHQNSRKPYRNFDFFDCTSSLKSEIFEGFWQAFGNNLTTLSLSQCNFSSIKEFRQVIYQSCPILQKLTIFECTFPYIETSEIEEGNELEYREPQHGEHKHLKSLDITKGMDFPISWIELFSHFPSLTSFQLSYIMGAEWETLLKAIRILRTRDQNMLPFKRFQFQPNFTISCDPAFHRKFALIRQLRLPLTNCFIRVDPEVDQRNFTSTLRYLAESVNYIELVKGKISAIPMWFRDFPFGIQMDNLTTLKSRSDLCGSFTFLKCAPNLSTLDISDDSDSSEKYRTITKAVSVTCKEELANVKMVRLTTLRLEFIVSDDDLQHLFNYMPNITHLAMVLNDTQLGMVCRNWKNLKNLTVFGNSNEVGIRSNIANLNVLDSLVLYINFTPGAVFDLFLHMPSLQFLVNAVSYRVVQRVNLDLSSYRRAIQDNVVEQWITDNGVKCLRRYLTEGRGQVVD